MVNNQMGFDSLPEKVSNILDKIDRIERILKNYATKETESGGELLNISEASKFTSLAKQTIYGLVSERKIPFIKRPGTKRLYFSRSELQDWIMAGRRDSMKPKEINNKW